MNIESLKKTSQCLRIEVIDMIWRAGTGHPGGSLSIADIMTVLYFHIMRIKPDQPDWSDRDRLVLSKGHAAPILYAALAEKGYFPKSVLGTLRQKGSCLQGHPDMLKTPGVDITSGCLGEGLSAAIGMSLAGKLDGKAYTSYAVLGDGELQEGQTWEAAMFAGSRHLNNLVAVLDDNGCMCDDYIDSILPMHPIGEKWKSFGWQVLAVDGHDLGALAAAFEQARDCDSGPVLIRAKCVKGKGVSFMENQPNWHGQPMNREEYTQAMSELGGEIRDN